MDTTTVETIGLPPISLELTWQAGFLERIGLAWGRDGQAMEAVTLAGAALKESLGEYLACGSTEWPELPLNWARLPRFSRHVLRTLKDEVPAGCWLSYSGLASRCGHPGGARAVGVAMRLNPWPLVVPCHRVLAKGKALGGFSGGLDLKRFLLALEGIETAGSSRSVPAAAEMSRSRRL